MSTIACPHCKKGFIPTVTPLEGGARAPRVVLATKPHALMSPSAYAPRGRARHARSGRIAESPNRRANSDGWVDRHTGLRGECPSRKLAR
jgi:hypothetical protein